MNRPPSIQMVPTNGRVTAAPERLPVDIDELVKALHERLADVRRRYELEAEPILRQIIQAESLRPIPPMIMALELAQRLGIVK